MKTLLNDSEEFQAALIYPERARPKRGVSPRWRTLAIIGWIVVGILTALSARGADFAGCADLALQPTAPHHRAACPAIHCCRLPLSAFRFSDLTSAPVAGVSPATEPDLAGCPPTLAARRHRGIL